MATRTPTIDSQVHAYERNRPERPWKGFLQGPYEVTGDDMGGGDGRSRSRRGPVGFAVLHVPATTPPTRSRYTRSILASSA